MIPPKEDIEFQHKLEQLINSHGIDNYCNIPDYILTQYMINEFENLKKIVELYMHHINTIEDLELAKNSQQVKITNENYLNLLKQGKLKEEVTYIIVEKPEEENYIEL